MQNRIDKVLKEQGKTYKDLVPLTGLNEYGIGQMAQVGDDETFGAWLSIARALDVSPAYLVGWSDEPNDETWFKERLRYLFGTTGVYIHSQFKKDFELLERLKGELNDLSEKRQRLDEFMSTNVFADLSYEEQYAMQRQREGMTEYMAALHKRIELIRGWMK